MGLTKIKTLQAFLVEEIPHLTFFDHTKFKKKAINFSAKKISSKEPTLRDPIDISDDTGLTLKN